MPMEKTFDARTAEPEISARWEAENAFRAGALGGNPAPLVRVPSPPSRRGETPSADPSLGRSRTPEESSGAAVAERGPDGSGRLARSRVKDAG